MQDYDHEKRFTADTGAYYLTAWDALVRLPIMRRRLDIAQRLSTRGYVSGYPGSPLGGLDSLFRRQVSLLAEHGVHFEPGVNEDLAATQVGGTQWLNTGSFTAPDDGVFGMWYGKGPGVERSTDAIRTSSYQGTARRGGVLAVAGDDHEARSTVTAQQSDTLFMHMHMPVLTPATVQDIVDFGLAGWDISRNASTWVGMVCVNDVAEAAMTVDVDLSRHRFEVPEGLILPPATGTPRLGGRGAFGAADIEQEIVEQRLPAAQALVRANGLDRLVFRPNDPERRTVGIITAGKTYLDVMAALGELDLSVERAAELGIGVYKVAMTWPMDPVGLIEFAEGFDELLVVEAKYPIMEDQVNRFIRQIPSSRRPFVTGKVDELGNRLLPQYGTLSSDLVARVLSRRLKTHHLDSAAVVPEPYQSLQLTARSADAPLGKSLSLTRKAGFCSGCPHNLSTQVPDGEIAISGTGCHNMSLTVDAPGRSTELIAQMGGEGALWIGMAPFAQRDHVFQNMGDGTYHHSGHLVIRAAVAANTKMTFKILFNGYIAMTGGQATASPQSSVGIAKLVLDEGVSRVAIVTEDTARLAKQALPRGTTLHNRAELDEVQRLLSTVDGPTVLIYDQACAAELRRERKRGRAPQPQERIFINADVCEGCGDCNIKSNCISVEPLETELGRKRHINQSSCNFDYSCATGNCPSFVTVKGATPRRASRQDAGDFLAQVLPTLPEPQAAPIDHSYNVLVGGIGGSGVLTVGALLGMAAHLEGRGVSVCNESGLAQKNGAVESHVKFTDSPAVQVSPRIGNSTCDVVLAADPVVASSPASLRSMRAGRTWACVNTAVNPTVAFAGNKDMSFDLDPMLVTLNQATHDQVGLLDAAGMAEIIMGDSIYGNLMLLGYAAQNGRLPVSARALVRAIEINGVAVDANKEAFGWGRLAAHDPGAIRRFTEFPNGNRPAVDPELDSIETLRQRRSGQLTQYQDDRYAARFDALIADVSDRMHALHVNDDRFTRAVIESAFKLMSYKDEYEVARLYTSPEFRQSLLREFEGSYKIRINLAPQVFNFRDKNTGVAKKWAFPEWCIMPVFLVLARMKGLRGTQFDPFGWTSHRRAERDRIDSYIRLVRGTILPSLTPANLDEAIELARVPQSIRGFDTVKDANAASADDLEAELTSQFLRAAPKVLDS